MTEAQAQAQALALALAQAYATTHSHSHNHNSNIALGGQLARVWLALSLCRILVLSLFFYVVCNCVTMRVTYYPSQI